MTKYGQVIAYNENTHIATIRYARPEACEKCGACSTGREETIELPAQCKTGDWVRVDLPEGKFLSATFLAYMVPLVLFLAGFLCGHLFFGTEGLTILCAMLGLGLGGIAIWLINKKISGMPEWTPHVSAVYEECPDPSQMGCGGHGAF